MKNPKILHLSYDIPKANENTATSAITDLIRISSAKSDPTIIVLERSSKKLKTILEEKENKIIIRAFGFPYGFYLLDHLTTVYNKIHSHFKHDFDFDIIHAHKLTFEGYIGYKLANHYNKKLWVSIRQTDCRVLRYRIDLVPVALNILRKAEKIFYISPFMLKKLKLIFGDKTFEKELKNKCIFLPNKVNAVNRIDKNHPYKKKYLITALRMDKKTIKRKNIKRLISAIEILKNEQFKFGIIGDGPDRNIIEEMITKCKVQDKVEMLGYIDHNIISDYFRNSSALILASIGETFGLVYGEALLSGTPILYSNNTGFNGMFEGIGVPVDPKSVESIARGIQEILNNNEFYRQNIYKLNEQGKFDIFNEDYILSEYFKEINKNEFTEQLSS